MVFVFLICCSLIDQMLTCQRGLPRTTNFAFIYAPLALHFIISFILYLFMVFLYPHSKIYEDRNLVYLFYLCIASALIRAKYIVGDKKNLVEWIT